jgi:cytochrome c biogenesis protein CcmG, thiol:disulfide interchange protein DsbE
MTNRQQWLLVAGIVVLLGAGTIVGSRFVQQDIPVIAVGRRAPEFEAASVTDDGVVRHLRDYEGQLVLLNVWATWCWPCQEEMPSMQRLYEEYGDRGLSVVAVSVDDPNQDDEIRAFAKEFGITFEVLHDGEGTIMQTYQLLGLPESFLIDPSGTVIDKSFVTDWYSDEKRSLVERHLPVPAS